MKNFPSPECFMQHRVSYGETDTMGVLYYAEYLHIFERSRSEYIRERGLSYAAVEAQGIFFPVREASCRYRASARYDDLIIVRAGIAEWGRASFKFVYEIYNEDKSRILAEGMTEHAVVNRDGRPCALPADLKEKLS